LGEVFIGFRDRKFGYCTLSFSFPKKSHLHLANPFLSAKPGKMRILLLQSYLGRKEPPAAPLGLAVLAANLSGHTVKIFDPNTKDDPFAGTAQILHSFQPEIIGVSLRNLDTTKYSDMFLYYRHFVKYTDFIARRSPDSVIAVGGSGFSLCPQQIMADNPALSFGFFREADVSFPMFIDNGLHPGKIRGIFYRNNDQVLFTGNGEPTDSDIIPSPAWELADLNDYLPYQHLSSIGVESKRGCAFTCAYCAYPRLSGRNVRPRAPKKVVDDIEKLRKLGVKKIFFTDPVFNFPLRHAESVCRCIIDKGLSIEWSAYHHPQYFTREYMELALTSGCADFYFSPDAASDRGMEILEKSCTAAGLHRCLDIIAANESAKASFNFFAAFPDAQVEDYRAAKKFIALAKAKLKIRLTRCKFSFIRLQPDTPAAAMVLNPEASQAIFLPGNLRALRKLYYISNPNRWVNLRLWLKFYWGILFGKRNTLH